MRTIFIGDVHGMLATLDDLLGRLALQTGDRLVFLGDLIDKGPDPVGVVRRVGELIENSDLNTLFVRGNHEDQHLRYRRNLDMRPNIARQQAERAPVLGHFHREAKDSDWAILNSALPFLKLPELNMLALHGGIPGNMREFPEEASDLESLSARKRDKFNKIWRTRYIDRETGVFLSRGREAADDPFWAEVYDGRFGHVVFGHEVFMQGPARFAHATGIDTGAVHGSALTAMIVNAGRDVSFVSAPGEAYSPNLKED